MWLETCGTDDVREWWPVSRTASFEMWSLLAQVKAKVPYPMMSVGEALILLILEPTGE